MSQAPPIYPSRIVPAPPNWDKSALPHEAIPSNNPMFRIDSRHVPSSEVLWSRMVRRIGVIVGACIGLWLLIVIAMIASSDPFQRTEIYGSLSQFIILMFWGSLLDKFILDFVGIFAGLNLIREEVTHNRWDLISLTPLRTDHIVTSKHALAQINAWNALNLVIGVRLSVVILIFFHLFLLPAMIPHILFPNTIRLNVRSYDLNELIVFFGAIVTFALMSFIYVVEPRWRLRALTAGGLALSANKGDISLSIVAGLWIFAQVWLSQVMIAFGSFFLLGMIGSVFFALAEFAFFGGFIYVGMVGYFIYLVYQGLSNRWLSKTWHELHKRRGTP